MRRRLLVAVSLLVSALGMLGAGCAKQIGDACQFAVDCSPNGDRQCDTISLGGYCTIQGCDFSTCPDEAVCVRFFTGSFENRECDYDTSVENPRLCSLDELCSLSGHCVPRKAEVRYCMKTCESNDDCRDDFENGIGYVCRDLDDMREFGGEPVLAPGVPVDNRAPKFCAAGPR